MSRRLLAAAVSLTCLLTACAGEQAAEMGRPASASQGPCTPSGTGTKDLTTKPDITARSGKPPAETRVLDIVCGEGDVAKDRSKLTLKFVLALYDGTEVDTTWTNGSPVRLVMDGEMMPGLRKGLEGMRVGGRREVVIPSKDAYGEQGSPPVIPAGATLVFVVDLVDIAKPPVFKPCKASGTGTTDLTKKPVVPKQTRPAPAETTTVDIVCGTGAQATEDSQVQVKYHGVIYADGRELDSSWSRSADETLPFTVGRQGVIPGFSKGVLGMKEGGRRMVIIAPHDAYGADGDPPKVPPNATLIFVLDLIKVS